jgi:hypothetical protein
MRIPTPPSTMKCMNDDDFPRLLRWVRVFAVMSLIAGFVAYVRANNAEAAAIFDADGDAGMWGVGIIVAAVLLVPGAVLLLVSLAIGPRTDGVAAIAMIGGVALLAPTAFLAVNLYQPANTTDEGTPLNPGQWDHVADLYLVAFVLLGAAGAILLVSAFPGLARPRSGNTHQSTPS